MDNYSNWDTWETVNWCLNTEAVKMALLNVKNIKEATEIIIKHMTMVKYCYASDVELNKINIKEVMNTIRDR